MQDWQQRVVEEKSDLDVKIKKLETFVLSEKWYGLDPIDQDLLKRQLFVMIQYTNRLRDRIARFEEA